MDFTPLGTPPDGDPTASQTPDDRCVGGSDDVQWPGHAQNGNRMVFS